VTLVDATLTHVWKPLLHEVAAGTADANDSALDFIAHARANGYRFQVGVMEGLDRSRREIILAPWSDPEYGEVMPRRVVPYDTLVIAVGSVSNDFDIPGVREHCLYLDTREQADRVQHLLLMESLRAAGRHGPARTLELAIVGAGATGVELAAELHRAGRQLVAYGLEGFDPDVRLGITVIEAAPRVLPVLPKRLASATLGALEELGIRVMTSVRVRSVGADGIETADGRTIPAAIKFWCAGIRAPDLLDDLDGLETAPRSGQLVVTGTLQTTRDRDVFAIGDCARCPQPGSDRPVPPRAQSAHQQARHLVGTIRGRLAGRPPRPFVYRDRGSLVSISYGSVGTVMGKLLGSVMIEGRLAWLAYRSLYRGHQLMLHGLGRLILLMVGDLIQRRTEPRLKLH
jgi:NADH dehydrogenase